MPGFLCCRPGDNIASEKGSNRSAKMVKLPKRFSVGERVFAKVRGYPPWPAKVSVISFSRISWSENVRRFDSLLWKYFDTRIDFVFLTLWLIAVERWPEALGYESSS